MDLKSGHTTPWSGDKWSPQTLKEEILKLAPAGCRLTTINRLWFIVGQDRIVHEGVRCFAWAKTLQLLYDNLKKA